MPVSTYANFDLLIDRSSTGYRARVIHSPAGEAAVEFALPFNDAELAGFLWLTAKDTRHLGAASDTAAPSVVHRVFGACLCAATFAEVSARTSVYAWTPPPSTWQICFNSFSLPVASNAPWLKPTRAFSIRNTKQSQPVSSQCITKCDRRICHVL
jgi:hypothetical protein